MNGHCAALSSIYRYHQVPIKLDSSSAAPSIVCKIGVLLNSLRNEGVGYGDYLEQLTYLLFLKMVV